MATDDCFEIGSGQCPCGKGIITVEKCVPDHPWAKESQASYTPALVCDTCGPRYAFFRHDFLSGKSRLVLRDDLEKHRKSEKYWHQKLREIESSPDFIKLRKQLDIRLAQEKSAAARYRLLGSAGLTTSVSLQRFRRSGYQLSSLYVTNAMELLGVNSPELEAKVTQAQQFADEMHNVPRGIKTGITGLEM
jgi:hypothetical protein